MQILYGRWTSHAAHAQWPIHSGVGDFVSPTYRAVLHLFVYDLTAQFPLMYLCWFVASVLSLFNDFVQSCMGVCI